MKAKVDMERTQMEARATVESHQMEMQKMQLQAHIGSRKLGMQQAATLAEHDVKQKTLAQQMQMVEQKRVAQESMAALGPTEHA